MWQRIQTALVLVVIVGIAMFASASPVLFVPLLLVGVGIAAHEFTKLMPKWGQPLRFVISILFIVSGTLLLPRTWALWWAASLVVWGLALGWVKVYPTKEQWYGRRLAFMGLVILISAITAMFWLWQRSPWWLLYVFLLVWCADSGAYFVGRKFGKKKLAPNVSPNKSLEGLGGGLALSLLVAAVLMACYVDMLGITWVLFFGLSALTVLASVLGDLFESMLKRRAGIKDSGTILPGHGGVLDRIDSLLSAVPAFALGFWAIGKFVGIW